MSLVYDPQELHSGVDAMFAKMARTNRDPRLAGVEQPLLAAMMYEYSNLEEAAADQSVPADRKKARVAVISRAPGAQGQFLYFVRKGRRNPDGSVQIGRSWGLEELSSLDLMSHGARTLIVGFRKPYFWVFSDASQAAAFEATLRQSFQGYTGAAVPSAFPAPQVPHVSRQRTVSRTATPQGIPPHQMSSHSVSPQTVPPHAGSQAVPQSAPQATPLQHSAPHHAPPPQTMGQMAPQAAQQATQQPTGRTSQQMPPGAGAPIPPQHQHQVQSQYQQSPQPQLQSPGYSGPQSPSYDGQPHTPVYSPGAAAPGAGPLFSPRTRDNRQQPPHLQVQPPHTLDRSASQSSQSPQVAPLAQAASASPSPHTPTMPDYPTVNPARSASVASAASRHAAIRERKGSVASANAMPHAGGPESVPPLRRGMSLQQQRSSPDPEIPTRAASRASQSSRSSSFSRSSQQNNGTSSAGVPTAPPHALPTAQEDPLNERSPPRHPASIQAAASGAALEPSPLFSEGRSTPALGKDDTRGDNAAYRDSRDSGRLRADSLADFSLSPIKSPPQTRSKPNAGHRKSMSASSLDHHISGEQKEMRALASVVDEFKWTGDNVTELELEIKSRLEELADENFAGVVGLDSQLDEIDRLIGESIAECDRVDRKMQTVAMNLAGKGDEVMHIEGQGDGLQVLAVNYRMLASEIEDLLTAVSIDSNVLDSIQNANFGRPGSSDTPQVLHTLETHLSELYIAVRKSSNETDVGGMGSMRALQERRDAFKRLATEFSSSYTGFIISQLQRWVQNAPSPDASFEDSLEVGLFRTFYIYSGCVLFARDAAPVVYRKMLRSYEKLLRETYTTGFKRSLQKWQQGIPALVTGRGPMALQKMEGLGASSAKSDHQPIKLSTQASQRLFVHLSAFIDQISQTVADQQRFAVKFFHLGTEGAHSYEQFLHREPLPQVRLMEEQRIEEHLLRRQYEHIDTSKSATETVLHIMQDEVFLGLGDLASETVLAATKLAPLESVYLQTATEIRSQRLRATSQQYLAALLGRLHKSLTDCWEDFAAQQTRSILSAAFTTKKRVGVHPVVTHFTEHVVIVEGAFQAAVDGEQRLSGQRIDASSSRRVLDDTHEKLYRAIANGFRFGESAVAHSHGAAARLKAAAKETAGGGNDEAKELLNRHVVMIENLFKIQTELEPFQAAALRRIVQDAKHHYKRELESYITDVLSRPLAKITAFLAQYESRTTGVKQKEVVSALKRAVQGFDQKDMQKGVKELHRRVEKHFTTDRDVLEKVWQAIGAEYLNVHQRLTRVAQSVDAMNYIDIQRTDIVNAFK